MSKAGSRSRPSPGKRRSAHSGVEPISSSHLARRAKPVRLPNLQPSKTAISLRLPVSLLEQIKIAANKRDVPYQSLIKMWLSEKVG